MLKIITNLFASPESLLNQMSQNDIQDAKDDGERILIDEDGMASVNLESKEVHEDFARHVEMLKRAKRTPGGTDSAKE